MGEADNLATLMAMLGQWVDRIRQRRRMKKLILKMDSSVSETYGHQDVGVRSAITGLRPVILHFQNARLRGSGASLG